MSWSRKQRRKSRRNVTVDFAELDRIVQATEERVLTPDEQRTLQVASQLLASYVLPVECNDETKAALLGEETDQAPDDKESARGHGRRPRNGYSAAKVIPVSHAGLKPGDLCPCGCGFKVYRVSRPGHFRHFVGQAPIQVTLYEREQLRCNACNTVFTADLPEGVGPSPYDATAVSTIAFSKYGMGLPFYRQAQQLELLGTPIPASTQYEIVAKAANELLNPAYRYLVKLGACGKVGYFDDTRMKILQFVREPGDDRTGIHTTGVISEHDDFLIALFFTGRDHAGENKAVLLAQRDPDLPAMISMSDALSSNFINHESDDVINACCLTHGRRNFAKIVDNFPSECRHVLTAIGTIYHNEGLSKELQHTDEQRLTYHQQHSGPVMEGLKVWLDDQIVGKKAEPNSHLGKAIQYLRNHWVPLTLFLRVAGAPLDTNIVERALKRVVLHRKNSLFYRTAKGARTGDIYMTIIQTCQLNGIDPFDYLTALQRHGAEVMAAPADWMPWTYKATLERTRVLRDTG